jgi:hypothetical protein
MAGASLAVPTATMLEVSSWGVTEKGQCQTSFEWFKYHAQRSEFMRWRRPARDDVRWPGERPAKVLIDRCQVYVGVRRATSV